jgi:hypothetical protein
MAAPSTKRPAKKAAPSPAQANGSADPAVKAKAEAPKKKAVAAKPDAPKTTPKALKEAPKETPKSAPKATPKTTETKPKAAPAKRTSAANPAPAQAAAEPKAKRVKKEKVVRDSFTMPKADYDKLGELKQKCLSAGVAVKKSELLRAGLLLLEAVPLDQLLDAIAAVETVKTGRPAKAPHHSAAH